MESYILSLHFSDHFTKETPSVHQHSLIALCAEHVLIRLAHLNELNTRSGTKRRVDYILATPSKKKIEFMNSNSKS